MIDIYGAELLRGLERYKPPFHGWREAKSTQLRTDKGQLSLGLHRQTTPNRDDRSARPSPDGFRQSRVGGEAMREGRRESECNRAERQPAVKP
jgi:hypothetical protein